LENRPYAWFKSKRCMSVEIIAKKLLKWELEPRILFY
jgi:hypothetical protein